MKMLSFEENFPVMAQVCLILGSNMGNRAGHISFARRQLSLRVGKELRVSSVYESDPWGYESRSCFLNQAIVSVTILEPNELMAAALEVELKRGRVRQAGGGYADRTLDIDIIYYDREIIRTPDLVIPHPRLAFRRFVLVPLLEVAPGWRHPVLEKTPAEMLESCNDTSEVRIYAPS